MNKFENADCSDFKMVLKKIKDLIGAIRLGSPLSQADAWIIEKVYHKDRLKIERLSGDSLSMEQCYINLAIVEKFSQDTDPRDGEATKSSQFSILYRKNVETPDESLQVELPTLFNPHTTRDGTTLIPRRILIRGRAGIGKTTLCKKIVYEFHHGTWSEWKNLFDRVLWIPLRKLKRPGGQSGYNLEKLCEDEYFSYPIKRRDLSNALVEALLTKRSKCLLLLDGLDEISHVLGVPDHDMKTLLDDLLSFPNVIVTSRPHVEHESFQTMDLQLETTGFYPTQVDTYIEKSFSSQTDNSSEDKVRDIKRFLRGRLLLQSLVRIPIQLDALCFTWQYWNPKGNPSSMTGIYKEIEKNLWAKDAVRMGKKHGEELVTHQVAIDEYEDLVADEMHLLEGLGFTGLWNDVIEFTAEHRKHIYTKFKRGAFLPAQTLPKLSFLRTSDHTKDINGNYHFIHLTFQEYFAAKYFVRQWKNNKELYLLALDSDNGSKETLPAQFLREQKYSTRYNIFWRFVAGLLSFRDIAMMGQTPADRVSAFFNVLEQEPIDLLGPTHQRLIIHCLSEINTTFPEQMTFQKRLAEWLLFECRLARKRPTAVRLPREVEFPDEVLKIALNDKTSGSQAPIIFSLSCRNVAAPGLITVVTSFLGDQMSHVRFWAARALSKDDNLPHDTLEALVALLEDDHEHGGREAATALATQETLPRNIVVALLSLLDNESIRVRRNAISAISTHMTFDDIITVFMEKFMKNCVLHGDGVKALGEHAALPEKMMAAVRELLDFAGSIQGYVFKVSPTRTELPDIALLAVIEQLGNDDDRIRLGAVRTLVHRAALPDTIKAAIGARLYNNSSETRADVIEILSERGMLSEETVEAIAAQLGDKSSELRAAAVRALGKHAKMINVTTVQAIAVLLGDDDSEVIALAVDALDRQAALPDQVLNAMAALLDLDAEPLPGWFIIRVLDRVKKILAAQSAIPRPVLEAAVANLDDENEDTRRAAAYTLRRQAMLPIKMLPDESLEALVPHLGQNDWYVQLAVVHMLHGLESMSDQVLTKIVVTSLDTRNDVLIFAAQKVLQRELALPNKQWPKKAVDAVLAQLQNGDEDDQYHATRILEGQPRLPAQVLEALVAQLLDEGQISRKAAKILESQTVLPPAVLEAATAWRDRRLRSMMRTLTETFEFRKTNPLSPSKDLWPLCEELWSQKLLPDDVLLKLVNLMRDNYPDSRSYVPDILLRYTKGKMLPTEILLKLVGLVRMGYGFQGFRVLGEQPTMPDEVLTELVALLGDREREIRRTAETLLRKHRRFYCTLFNGPHGVSLYRVLFEKSFEEHITWYILGNGCHVSIPGLGTISLDNSNKAM